MRAVTLKDVVWPYRPDVLIRIDFLRWYLAAGESLLQPSFPLLAETIRENSPFFTAAQRHPYFLHYSRKERYRRRNLNREESAQVYAEGIAAFLNLYRAISANGFQTTSPIVLKKGLWIQQPFGGRRVRRPFYIGNGCHRYAALALIRNGEPLNPDCFRVRRFISHRPLNWVAIFERLGILDESLRSSFEELFRVGSPAWQEVINWGEQVRGRFQTLEMKTLFEVRFER